MIPNPQQKRRENLGMTHSSGVPFWVLAVVLVASSAALSITSVQAQKPYPNRGDFYYGGTNSVSATFMWEIPGNFQLMDPGYEHNFTADPEFWNFCTSWTNLPHAYDDCTTAGYTENDPTEWSFGVGSYHLIRDYRPWYVDHDGYHDMWVSDAPIEPNVWYYADWSMGCSPDTRRPTCWKPSTRFKLGWQEVKSDLCWRASDYPQCMIGVRGSRFMTGYLTYGESYFSEYLYDPVTGDQIY
jgi:hypothetical protein